MKKILVVSVHPDDETLGCGGTILKHIAEGDQVACLFITSGNSYQQKIIDRLTKCYGFSTYVLGLPELCLQDLSLNDIIPRIVDVFRLFEPQILYIPNRSDIHSDHRVVFEAVMACSKVFRFPYIEKILMCEVISETDFVPALPEMAFTPNIFVNISSYFKNKIEILELFESELLSFPHTRNIEVMTALNRYRGSQAGVEFAEAFMLLKCIIK